MTDKTDPRLDVLHKRMVAAAFGHTIATEYDLAALDAADRAAGIVRVDTRDEALRVRLRTALLYGHDTRLGRLTGDQIGNVVDVMLAALREAQ